ncbi:MAG: hypothetical protein WAL27_08755 [Cellulosimicrobium cellulans]
MTENTGYGPDQSASGDGEEHGPTAHKYDSRRSPMNQMRTVGQRRRDSEEKLEQHQREARTVLHQTEG